MPLGQTKVLILSNRLDSSASALVEQFESFGVLACRWNSDMWQEYEIRVDSTSFEISDRRTWQIDLVKDDVRLAWRKPFLDQIQHPNPDLVRFTRTQMGAVLRSIISVAQSKHSLLVEPYADERLPKLKQLQQAQAYFQVPEYEFSIQANAVWDEPVITKALRDSIIGNGLSLDTTPVDSKRLERPFPWFLQRQVIGGKDITVVFIDGNIHWFICDYARTINDTDWRVEINSDSPSAWRPANTLFSDRYDSKVASLMNDFGLRFGRLDFLVGDDGALHFLECNPNGEFGWLDEPSLSLHREYAEAVLRIV
jgi:hypothetical protein